MALCEYEEAVEYFHKHYVLEAPEIAFYVLLGMISTVESLGETYERSVLKSGLVRS